MRWLQPVHGADLGQAARDKIASELLQGWRQGQVDALHSWWRRRRNQHHHGQRCKVVQHTRWFEFEWSERASAAKWRGLNFIAGGNRACGWEMGWEDGWMGAHECK